MNRLKITILSLFALMAVSLSAQLPSAQVKTLDGKMINTSKLSNDGKPFVITFWATWCKPCQRELKAINELYADWQDETGMKVYAVSIDQGQNIEKVKPLVDTEGWEFDFLLDPNSDFFRAMGGQMVPFLVIVDGNGNVVESKSGYIDGSEEHIIEKIKSIK
jgi:thiol-disulfide isomerase/thioredoxin